MNKKKKKKKTLKKHIYDYYIFNILNKIIKNINLFHYKENV